ncbi:MAG: lipopolysaccharide transport system ATP-binding protein [Flavobacteriaceae bacterium]|jgi:lipopolysaccharide transport system ATP-binding protein
MSDIILKAEHISKQYRLGIVGTGTMSDDLKRWWFKIRGKDDPYLKVGDVNDRSTKATSNYVWALQDINFEVKRGEVLGIIGKNGAGKSTLLKILSRVTGPTTGEIRTRGRIASLLEVGTGFHPELTGRENIYLNGAILGMTKEEITHKLDEIISFSGCERYIDTPVKRYSSGMTVRLAFAVAAFLEPDILVIDEVLAVGDAEFQKKAIGKMQDISNQDGRTVLFVSHNMAAVKSLCTRTIVLEHGQIVFNGNTNKALSHYLMSNIEIKTEVYWDEGKAPGNMNAKIKSVRIIPENEDFVIEDEISIEIEYENYLNSQTLNTTVSIFDNNGIHILSSPDLSRNTLSKGVYVSKIIIDKDFLNTGKYFFTVYLIGNNFEVITELEDILSIDINELGIKRKDYFGHWGGVIRPHFKWNTKKIN